MPHVAVLGAGPNGLATALLLAKDGYRVTVLERDQAHPEPEPERLWEKWERPGVSQFRLPHVMLAHWRRRMERELPEVIEELERAGGTRLGPLDTFPVGLTGGSRPGDEELRCFIARRPVIEGALAVVAARARGVTVHRGAKVTGLVASSGRENAIPKVNGAVTEDGDLIEADLVVDAMGRRTPVDAMLRAVGGEPAEMRQEDLGFVYYCRHFRAGPGVQAPLLLSNYESVTLFSSVADAGTFCLAFTVASNDRKARKLRNVDVWERVLTLFPGVTELRASSVPITGVQVMAGGPDRRRSFMVDGSPVVTGLVAVGDSHVLTNPTVARGMSIGLAHACCLRDTLRDVQPDRPEALAHRFFEVSERVIGPLCGSTNDYDRHRMAEVQAFMAGENYQPTDSSWIAHRMLEQAAREDPDALRRYLRHLVLDFTAPELADLPPAVRAEADMPGHALPAYPSDGPTHAELAATIGRSDD